MVVQTLVVGNDLMVERMQLGKELGNEVEPLLRLGKGMEPPMVVQTTMVRLHLGQVLMVELLLL